MKRFEQRIGEVKKRQLKRIPEILKLIGQPSEDSQEIENFLAMELAKAKERAAECKGRKKK